MIWMRSDQTISVEIHGLRSAEGHVRLALFRPSDVWMKEPLLTETIPARKGAVSVKLQAPASGIYAITVFHDTDGDGKLRTNVFGIPREGFGFSNNAMGIFGPPGFKEASFAVPASQPLRIDLRHY